MKQIKLSVLLFLAMWNFNVAGQKKLQSKSSGDLIELANKHIENKRYDQAEASIKLISENDTNYVSAQRRLASVYLQQERYSDASKLLEGLLDYKIAYEKPVSVYYLLAAAYSGEEKFERAQEVLSDAIVRFPMNDGLYLLRGKIYTANEQWQEALNSFKKAVQINMGNAEAHVQLGHLAAMEGGLAQAMMSYMSAILVEPRSELAQKTIGYLEEIGSGSFTPEPRGIKLSEQGDNFTDVNLYIKNKVALQPSYKAKFTFPLSYAKQFHLLLNGVQFDANDKGFWQSQYLEVYSQINKAKQLDGMITFSLQSVGNKDLRNAVAAKQSQINKFLTVAAPLWSEATQYQEMDFEGSVQRVSITRNQGQTYVVKINDAKKPSGNLYNYYESGNLQAIIPLDNLGKKDGVLKVYDNFTGTLIRERTFKNDKLNGIEKEYYTTGELETISYYKDGLQVDSVVNYYRGGQIEDIIYIANQKRHGRSITYFSNGVVSYESYFKDGQRDGLYKSFFQNGQLDVEVNFVAGKRQGTYKSFYPDGAVRSEYVFKDDLYNGPFKQFHPNGQLEQSGQYVNGKMTGEIVNYYSDGVLASKTNLDESGKENGLVQNFDTNGKIYQSFEYKKGIIQKIEVFDVDGKVIESAALSGKKLNYISYYPTRHLRSKGEINNDKREGEWLFFNEYGDVVTKEKYVDGNLQGEVVNYFFNGNVESKIQYLDGEKNGLYLEYDIRGQLIQEGRFEEGEEVNDWYEYYSDGTISEEYAFTFENRHGYFNSYDVNGKLERRQLYSHGVLISETKFNQHGEAIEEVGLLNGDVEFKDRNGKFVVRKANMNSGVADGKAQWFYVNGQLQTEGNLVSSKREGVWTWYTEDGKLDQVTNYVYDKRHGEAITYENGKILSKSIFQNGKIEGLYTRYFDNGNLDQECMYRNGQRHGKMTTYSYDGKVQQIRYYDMGVLIGYSYLDKTGKELPMIPLKKGENTFTVYYQNGQKAVEQTRINDHLHGAYKEYYTDGKLMNDFNYKFGESEGKFLTYYQNGNVKEEENYVNDVLEGEKKLYYPNGKLKLVEVYHLGELNGEKKLYSESGQLLHTFIYVSGDMVDFK